MSRKTNNKDPKIPGNSDSPEHFEDPFEKEAAEGFALLGDETEVTKAKAELDQRMYAEVFAPAKKSRPVYWVAAAALILVVGFTVYLFNSSEKEKNLALAPSTVGFTAPPQATLEESSSETTVIEKVSAEKPKPQIAPDQYKQADKNLQENVSVSQTNGMSSAGSAANTTLLEGQVENAIGQKDDQEEDIVAPPIAAASVAPNSDRNDAKEERLTINADKKQNTFKTKSDENGAVYTSAPQSAPRASQIAVVNPTCYYEAGTIKLNKDVGKLLQKKELQKSFEAKLTIDATGQVIKAEIFSLDELTDSQKKEVSQKLLQLKNFVVTKKESPAKNAEYILIYKP